MDLFETIRAPMVRLSLTIFRKGSQAIPSDHKGIFATLFFIIFSTITGVGIVVPLLPIYAHDLGATGFYVAMIFGSFSISRVFLLPYFGRLSDQKGRKPFILAGLIFYTLISIAFIFSDTVKGLIVIRFIQGAGSAMIMPVVQAYVAEITPKGSEGYAMGLFNLSMFLSLSLGPVMGGVINDIWNMDAAFVCMGLLSFVGVLLCLILLPPLSEERLRSGHQPLQVPWALVIRDIELFGLFSFRFAYTACIGAIWSFSAPVRCPNVRSVRCRNRAAGDPGGLYIRGSSGAHGVCSRSYQSAGNDSFRRDRGDFQHGMDLFCHLIF